VCDKVLILRRSFALLRCMVELMRKKELGRREKME